MTEIQTQYWQVSWNAKKYDYQRLIRDYQNGRHTGFITNAKGMAKMKVLPQTNDCVYVSCDKNKIMKCRVASEFITNDAGCTDEYSIGPASSRTRASGYPSTGAGTGPANSETSKRRPSRPSPRTWVCRGNELG